MCMLPMFLTVQREEKQQRVTLYSRESAYRVLPPSCSVTSSPSLASKLCVDLICLKQKQKNIQLDYSNFGGKLGESVYMYACNVCMGRSYYTLVYNLMLL